MQEKKISFALESPKPGWFQGVRSPFIVSGWVLPIPGNRSVGIEVEVNGRLRASTSTGLRRQDVANAYPNTEGALWSGFAIEVFVDDLARSKADVAVRGVFDDGDVPLGQFQTQVRGLARVVTPRPRDWAYSDILACPLCLAPLQETESCFPCHRCEKQFHKRRGIPTFTNGDEVILSHLLETNPTNPNAEDHTKIIKEAANDLVLDLGAGNPRESEHYPNVVFHEFVHYAHTDVVCICDRLPYREGVFDAVISKAAFEHMVRPWEMAAEIYRVLKPGGLLHVDTAFMQPVHGDPYHFFNMTLEGAKEIFKSFEMIRCGIKPYQTPAYGLRMQIDVMLEHLKSEDWRRRFQELKDSLGYDFDNALDAKGRERLAAGVFFEGTKPSA
jgi:SAM-dependent methyltransferase